jgi:hypothetical protein
MKKTITNCRDWCRSCLKNEYFGVSLPKPTHIAGPHFFNRGVGYLERVSVGC